MDEVIDFLTKSWDYFDTGFERGRGVSLDAAGACGSGHGRCSLRVWEPACVHVQGLDPCTRNPRT